MTISDWLSAENRDYQTGLVLYASVRCNRNILKMLQRKESQANRDKLFYELGKFAPKTAVSHFREAFVEDVQELSHDIQTAVITLAAGYVATAEESRDRLMFHDLPADLRPELLKKNQAFAEMCMLKIQLNELAPEKEREAFTIQVKIAELQKTRDLCWKKLDYWLEHRSVPEPEVVDFASLTPEQKVKRQQLLFASISKLKSRVNEYQTKLATDLPVKTKASLERKLLKSKTNLISKESELLALTNLIEGL